MSRDGDGNLSCDGDGNLSFAAVAIAPTLTIKAHGAFAVDLDFKS